MTGGEISPQMKLQRILLDRVTRRFGRHLALRGVTVGFDAGEVALLLGPNGAGKTTLMRVVSTLLRPTAGRVTGLCGGGERTAEVDLYELAAVDRSFVGLVSHASLVYQDLTGWENLKLFGGLYDLDPEMIQAKGRSLLEEMELSDAADRPVAEYSRGMMQRLSIARALIHGPSVLLLDEPFTGLDQSGRRILHDVLRRVRAEGALVMLITHHLDIPEDVIDRVLLLSQGKVVRDERSVGANLNAWYERGLVEAVH